jgi:hypothetical protein
VYKTFSDDVVVLRRFSDLHNKTGERRYGSDVLPPGCYITNSNLLFRPERKATQLRSTLWDAVIADEAHRISGELMNLESHTLLANQKTKTLLLTATPFQLSPSEMKGLLADTFSGCETGHKWEGAWRLAESFYESDEFREYRGCLNHYFRCQDGESLKRAGQLREAVSEKLRERIIRNPKKDRRRYHFVDNEGIPRALQANLFELGDQQLTEAMARNDLIVLEERDIDVYLNVRNQLAESCAEGKKPFVAAALRQLLSTYEQFRNSEFARHVRAFLPKEEHPKLDCVKQLARRIIENQVNTGEARRRGWFEKILIFTTYVGGEHGYGFLPGEKRYGTASTLKRVLEGQVKEVIPVPNKNLKQRIGRELRAALRDEGDKLRDPEYDALDLQLRRFAGSRCGSYLLFSKRNLKEEKRYLGHQLRRLGLSVGSEVEEEQRRRAEDRRARRLEALMHRYTTRDLVARYDGALDQTSRDRHLRGFNSPYAPLVLVASSVGQEGVDLQKYCSHVVHYDLEWNPAKLEQREGRVDRQGREAAGPVNVYFMICRGTYDERVLHVMVNRMRWHQVLLPNRKALYGDISSTQEARFDQKQFAKVTLNLRPKSRS